MDKIVYEKRSYAVNDIMSRLVKSTHKLYVETFEVPKNSEEVEVIHKEAIIAAFLAARLYEKLAMDKTVYEFEWPVGVELENEEKVG